MLIPVVVVLESLLSIEWRIDIDTLDRTRELLFKSLQREQVVAKNQAVVETV